MSEPVKEFVVIGSSRGLGAALVDEILLASEARVTGISRTPFEELQNHAALKASDRYRHVQLDIAGPGAPVALKELFSTVNERICVIFNAAHIAKDFSSGEGIDFPAAEKINRVGILGLWNALLAFEKLLSTRGGVFVGVSSFWGSVTPLYLSYIAYPASKAYLDSVLRSISALWEGRVTVVKVTIGNIKNPGDVKLPTWFIPTYRMGARSIVRKLLRQNPPRDVVFPAWHGIVYRYFLRYVPAGVFSMVASVYLAIEKKRRHAS